MTPPKLILKVNASALKESACMRRLYWIVVSGYKEKLNKNDVEYGSAFHEFVKSMKENPGRYDLAVAAATKRFDVPMEIKPEKVYMNSTHLLQTCMSFWENWVTKDQFETVKDAQGKPLVELKFSYPYYSDDQVEVQLCGTIDDICKHKHGTYALRDYKTTSVYKTDEYLSAYALSSQLMFYRMVLDYYSRTYPTSLFAEINKKDVACMIDAVFLRGKSAPVEFKRSEVFIFNRTQMDEFEHLVYKKVMELVAIVKENKLPVREGMLNGACQTVYGHCKFFGACKQPDDVSAQHMLTRFFKQEPYDPLNH
jgi:hypothetical protein